jgi:hypothetical protein
MIEIEFQTIAVCCWLQCTSARTKSMLRARLLFFGFLLAGAGLPASVRPVAPSDTHQLVIDLTPPRPSRFNPNEALGAGVDGAHQGEIDKLLTPRNVAAMKQAGLRALTYRLRTELGIEAWHWNPSGKWSDEAHSQGYWTSSDRLGRPISLSWGYRLPRRGDTIDNANDDDFSRLTDGDLTSFWKSNPYLDPSVLKDGREHPQWIMLHFGKSQLLDTAIIDWAEPYATRYEVQYWTGSGDYDPAGRWVTFPHGRVEDGRGGRTFLHLADKPIATSHVRVLLHAASATAPAGSSDWRDRLGFAVREVSFGLEDPDGSLDDVVVHAPIHDRQTVAHVSSTDPWHRAIDRDLNLEQAGVDRVFASGLSFGGPVMMPTGLLYDTPDNMAAELRYIARRHYPVTQIELGEEPDGQYAPPDDYAALYLAAVDRLQGIIPHARFGGPSMQSAFTVTELLPESRGSWAKWFVDYLRKRNRLKDLGFYSFEYYPFDDICGDINAKLIEQSHMMDDLALRLRQDGVPQEIPWIISEYGFSAFAGKAMSEMPSGLLMAGIVGQWLSLGGKSAYMFGYGPNLPANENSPCAGFGNMMLFMAGPEGQAAEPMPSYHTAQLLTQRWTVPGGKLHGILGARVENMPGDEVKAYAVGRPDRRIAVMIINRSATTPFTLALVAKNRLPLQGPGEIYSFGPGQYAWRDDGPQSRPERSEPAVRDHVPAGPVIIVAPPQTVSVLVLPVKKVPQR